MNAKSESDLRLFCTLLIGLAGFLLACGRLAAEQSTSPVVSFAFENDVDFLSRKGDDRFYTNGVRLVALWPECHLPFELGKKPGLFIPFVGRELAESPEPPQICTPTNPDQPSLPQDTPFVFNFGLSLGQNLYTPEDLRTSLLQRNDRPYGAWLYLGALITLTGDRLSHSVELDLGTVGPSAFGEEVQDFVHEHISGSPEAQGWDHQINDEPGLLLSYELRWRLLELEIRTGSEGRRAKVFDVIPTVGASGGNIFSFLKAGLMARAGWNVPADFGPPGRIIAVSQQAAPDLPPQKWSFYFFAAAEGRNVGRNIFLDGNTFTDSHSVSRENFVADLELGFVLRYRKGSLAYRQVRRSQEWTGQRERQVFGGVILTWGIRY